MAQNLIVADELVVVIPAKFPPYYFINENNRPDGFAIEVFEEVAARAGLRFRYDVKENWAGVNEALKNGLADIVPNMGITARRAEYTLFTSPVETCSISIFVRNSNTSIKSVKDLVHQTVAIVKGHVGESLLENDQTLTLKKYQDFESAFQALLSGQVDAMVYPYPVMMYFVKEYELSDKIRAIAPPLIEIKRSMGVTKSSPQIRDKLETALQALIRSERYQQIYRKWFADEKPFWDVQKVFWSMAGLMVAVVFTFLWFRQRELLALNASLQQQIDQATQQLSQSNEYLKDLTVTDTLTGVSNRRAFENNLQELITRAHRYHNQFSMLIFDIDNFKRLNDQYGHDMGDRVLKELVERISGVVRDVDVLSRWGGEEFTILMYQTGKEGAIRMAERCRHVVANTLFDEVGPVTISVGVTCYQTDDTERKLFKRADDALYQAKESGKNRVVWKG